MRKSARRAARRKAEEARKQARQEHVVGVARMLMDAGYTLRRMVLNVGFEVLQQLLEEDREQLCGPPRKKQEQRQAYRYGHEQGQVVLGGRKVSVPRPRVRSVENQEIQLPTWQQVTSEDPLIERAVEQMVLGVSTRNYHRSLEPLPPQVESVGVSRSSVSRRFVAKTRAQVEKYLSRPLDELDLPVMMLDGTLFGEHLLVVAIGIDTEGHKHVLGLVEGSSESEAVGRALLRNLLDRGLVVERARLFVIDGSRGLRKAIRTVFANWALIQRCHFHKCRNVCQHLPKSKREWLKAALRKAWAAETADGAKRRIEGLAARFEEMHPGAAASLLEGLDETLTLHKLGLKGALYRTLRSTNLIENLQGSLKRIARRVTRWRGGFMAMRWAVSGLAEAETRFRRVKGFRDMYKLVSALEAEIAKRELDNVRKVA